MDDIIVYAIFGILAVAATCGLWYARRKGWIEKGMALYVRYQILIDAIGAQLRKDDPVTYNKLVECCESLKNACADNEITPAEMKVIYERCKELYDHIKSANFKNK